MQRRRPVRVAGFGDGQLDVEIALDLVARRHDAFGAFDQLLLVPGDLLGQLELEMQRAIADVGGAEIAAGFMQLGTGLFAVTLIQRRIELGAGLLEPVDGSVEVFIGLCSRNLWLSMISDGQGQPLSGFQSSS